jgi:ProQ/FINO family
MGETAETQTPAIRTAATELLTMLCSRYPEAFVHEGEPPKPLAIGITERLITELALDAAVVKGAMRLYTRRRAYQQALSEPGAMRVDLTGQPTEPVAPEHQVHARIPRPAARPADTTPTAPITFTLDQWEGLTPMHVTATLKLVLRELPETRESNGLVYMALENEPRGLPKNITLDSGPLYLSSPVKQWKAAITKAEQIRATGTPALLIVEAHVSTKEGALIGVVKTVQVVEGKVLNPQAG